MPKQRLQGGAAWCCAPSGTEPVVRVTVEADDAALMEQVLGTLSDVVKAAV